jgi:hypothetical protein
MSFSLADSPVSFIMTPLARRGILWPGGDAPGIAAPEQEGWYKNRKSQENKNQVRGRNSSFEKFLH